MGFIWVWGSVPEILIPHLKVQPHLDWSYLVNPKKEHERDGIEVEKSDP